MCCYGGRLVTATVLAESFLGTEPSVAVPRSDDDGLSTTGSDYSQLRIDPGRSRYTFSFHDRTPFKDLFYTPETTPRVSSPRVPQIWEIVQFCFSSYCFDVLSSGDSPGKGVRNI